jgi:hypothetical protein
MAAALIASWPGDRETSRVFGEPSAEEARRYQQIGLDRRLRFQGVRARYLSRDNKYAVLKRWYGAEVVELADETNRRSIEAYWTDLDVGAAHLAHLDEDSNAVFVYDFADMDDPVWTWQSEKVKIVRAGFSGDGARVVLLTQDGTLTVFDAPSGAPLWSRTMPDLRRWAVSEDLSRLVYYSDESTQLWDMAAGQCVMELKGCLQAEISADGGTVLFYDDDEVQVWRPLPLVDLMENVRRRYEGNFFSPAERRQYFLD